MPCHIDPDLGPDEEWVEDEGADDDDAEILQCPSCRYDVHEDTQQCPHCGDWITPVYGESNSKRWFITIAVVLMLISMVMIAIR
jgi:RNA polymerase subunit RPABC4/transcription elongation factor Spt4